MCVGLCLWCVVCVVRLGTRKNCVPAKRAHVFNMRAFCQYTRKRFEPTHGDFLNLHTVRREAVLFSLSLVPSLFLLLSLFRRSLHSFSFSFSLLFSLSNNDNDHSSSRFSLCTHRSDLPECQSAWAVAHSLLAEHVRIMPETTVLV